MSSIRSEERENLCKTIAAFFASPETETIKEFQKKGGLTFFQETIASLGGDLPFPDRPEVSKKLHTFFKDWPEEYERLFSGLNSPEVSLVESFYKPWTLDPGCRLSFAGKKGRLQGDPAHHVSAVYQHCGMEVFEEFKACPDHLVVEMEFLSLLYQCATDHEIRIFIRDHLDWVPVLKQELSRFHPHPAYALAVEVLDLFLKREKERLMIM
jgi:TorA maturation chaperone TorD